jgi:hypothetical protein
MHPDAEAPRHADGSAGAVQVVTTAEGTAAAARALATSARVAFDLESNGLFAYRPTLCMLSWRARTGGSSSSIRSSPRSRRWESSSA